MSSIDIEIEQINFAIEHENLMRTNLEKENQEIERNIQQLQEKIFDEDNNPNDTEWGKRYLAQADINIELNKQINQMKEKMKQLVNIEPNEDSNHPSKLNDTDLRSLMKQLQKEKHVLEGNLKDLEWRLDSESQDLFRLNEEKEKYKLDFNQAMSVVDDACIRSKSLNTVGAPVPSIKFSSKSFNNNIKNRNYGIPNNYRILDARKGPVKKTAAVKILPKLDVGTPLSADSALKSKAKKRAFKTSQQTNENNVNNNTDSLRNDNNDDDDNDDKQERYGVKTN